MKIRLFLNEKLVDEARVSLDTATYNYLVNVLRSHDGDEVFVFNSVDGEFRANIEFVGKKQACLIVREKVAEAEPLPDVELLCPLLKKDTVDLTVQKATELGVGRIRLVQTDRTNAARVNVQRLCLIAKEAAEQSRRVNVPQIDDVNKLSKVLENWSSDRVLFFLDETGGGSPIAEVLSEHKKKSVQAAFLVGPEGGFSPAEIEYLYSLSFAKGIALDKHILRAETAACVALALWKYI